MRNRSALGVLAEGGTARNRFGGGKDETSGDDDIRDTVGCGDELDGNVRDDGLEVLAADRDFVYYGLGTAAARPTVGTVDGVVG